MDDLIERQAAIDAVLDRMNVEKHGRDAKPEEIQWTLEKLPSAQPHTEADIQKMQDLEQAELEKAFELGREDALSEIVRCKECKHSEHWYRDKRRCFLWVEDGIAVFDDGFCNYGEMKEDATD